MTKRFYTCPIEAAYMADNFGLRVKPEVDKSTIRSFYGVSIYAMYLNGTCEGKMFVSPDSLSIFEPQRGDLIQSDNYPEGGGHFGQINDFAGDDIEFIDGTWLTDPEDKAVTIKIIQRNNKPFIMPEVEE